MNDAVLRENLVALLKGGHAYVPADQALNGVTPKLRNVRPVPTLHSVWELLEHMRITQEDILRYTLDASWKSPEFPEGYWPKPAEELTEPMWSASLSGFLGDLKKVMELVKDPGTDLTARIPHGEWRTYLREVLLVADHNAYHLGQVVQTRKTLGDWPSS